MSVEDVIERVNWLVDLHSATRVQRERTRAIMNGGAEAIRQLLGDKLASESDLVPIPPLMSSGLTRLGQKIGGTVPDLKVPVYGYNDSDRAKRNAELRERLVLSYDEGCALDLQLSQQGRWLPGYGFGVWTIRDGFDEDGSMFPYMEAHDPYGCYPGPWTIDGQPSELAIEYRVPLPQLRKLYPDAPLDQLSYVQRGPFGAVVLDPTGVSNTSEAGGRSPSGKGLRVVEYWYEEGTFVTLPDQGILLDYIPNPIAPHNRFVVAKRVTFDRLVGQYDYMIGLLATIAKLDLLAYIFTEDSVLAETNIFGEQLEQNRTYRRGRNAVNRFAQGTRVEKPVSRMPPEAFAVVERVEERLRVGASYPHTDDGTAPVKWLTGQGLDRLSAPLDTEVREYHKVLRRTMELADARRLEWDDRRNRGTTRALVGYRKGEQFSEKYTPSKDINGRYKTRRVYGFAAGWDEPAKIVTGLQLMDAEVLDLETVQENLDGIDSITRIQERNRARRAEQAMLAMLEQAAADPTDPQAQAKARLALRDIKKSPDRFDQIIDKWFSPEGEEVSPEEEQFMAAQAQAAGGGPGGMPTSPEDITTVLSRLEMGGGVEGGIQRVGRL